ncbi:MAG: hypothetical protein MPF33_03920 [Candidatus Aramenus sp.]|jgi:hypothetical protein|nr:hypothetical protein [Candidatus Aramenus sp.]
MKVSASEEKYLIDLNRRKFLVEAYKTEKGEKVYTVSEVRSYKLPNGEEWTPDTNNAKTLDLSSASPELKKVIRSIVIRL